MLVMARLEVLVIGATGSVGPLVGSPAVAVGDVTKPERLSDALKDVDAMVLPTNADGRATEDIPERRPMG
jgi:uncharacterized protein YbjT (DUF2867 family)